MIVGLNESGEVVSRHLPPVDASLLLEVGANRRVRAIEKIETPIDAFGVPSAFLYLAALAETLHPEYTPPKAANVHHLVNPKRSYTQGGKNSIKYKYRESPSLMLEIPVQIHNYGHWIMQPPAMPHMDVMTQRVKEQDQINKLFKIGRSVIAAPRWLDEMYGEGMQTYRAAEDYINKYEPTEAMFYDTLDACEDGIMGLMPDRQELADIGLRTATAKLGVLAGARALTLQRESVDIVRRQAA